MKIVDLATRRPVTIAMITLAVLLFGAVSLSRLEVNLLPDLSYPSLTIRTDYTGGAPSEIETLITKPVEEALGVIKGVRQVRSVSRSGQSDVILEFAWGTNMDFAVLDVREKLDALELPEEIRRPLVLRFDPSSEPIMRLGFAFSADKADLDTASLKRLRRVAEQQIQKSLEAVEGVAAVKISGGLEDEIQILLDQHKLSQLDLPIDEVIERVKNENVNLSGGRVEEGTLRYLVRTLNQFRSLEDIAATIISSENERNIYLRDIAEVRAGHREREAIIRINGDEAVELSLYKEGDTNTVNVARKVDKRLEGIKKRLPEEFSLTSLYDQSIFIRQAIDNVVSAALLGGLLAVLVLYFFLRSAWITAIISLAIPVSVIATFNMMYMGELSLNIMSLGGIALAIGLLVDNAIVVLENIARHREMGKSSLEAARIGAGEVGGAVTASTLTTVAVFFPMVFVQGIAGELFSDQALVVTFALSISLLVSLSLIPMLAARGEKPQAPLADDEPTPKPLPSNILLRGVARVWRAFHWLLLVALPEGLLFVGRGLFALGGWLLYIVQLPFIWLFNKLYSGIERLYPRVLAWALRHRATVVFSALALFAFSLSLIPRIGVELIPSLAQNEFSIEHILPPGTPLERTDELIAQTQKQASGLAKVKTVFSVAGTGNRLDANPDTGGENYGVVSVVMEQDGQHLAQERAKNALRESLGKTPGLEYRFTYPTLFSLKTPLEIEIAGYDLDKLKAVNDSLLERMRGSDRFTEIESSMEIGHPEIQIRFDQERTAALGLKVSDVAENVVSNVRGQVATRYRLPDREIDVLVRTREQDRASVEELSRLIINPKSERPITLDAIAEIAGRIGPAEIRRIDQQRVGLIQADVAYGDLGAAVEEVHALLAGLAIPSDVTVRVTGQSEEMETSFSSMKLALLLAVFMVYLVMASQFESLLHPFVILFTIPLALIGAVLALYVSGSVINVVVFIGLIVLAGIVVNNGIVLVDLINRLRDEGQERVQAIMQAGRARLRPIVMTTLTTALGLLPLAIGFGEGAEVRAPLAITVIGGLLVATLLTLVVIPVAYTLLDRRRFPQDAARSQ